MLTGKLTIDGKEVPLTWEYALRFMESSIGDTEWGYLMGGDLDPLLYRNGRRVTKAWTLRLDVEQLADPYGGNGNTAD